MGKILKRKAGVSPARRSLCPVSCTLELLGDRWSLLVVRDLFFGRSRFKDFLASPEKIPTNVLAERLQRLQGKKLVEQIASPDGTLHKAYALTPKGRSLLPIIKSLRDWGLEWIEGTEQQIK
jgi:DNA-binding HxlR family transcriptional regulator